MGVGGGRRGLPADGVPLGDVAVETRGVWGDPGTAGGGEAGSGRGSSTAGSNSRSPRR